MLVVKFQSCFNSKMYKASKTVRIAVISPKLTLSPFSIPGSPPQMSIENINRINNIYYLRKLEDIYDVFLEKSCQILMLLNYIDEVLEIRDALTIRINYLKRQKKDFYQII